MALLGLNIFSYLAKGTDVIGDFIAKFSSHAPKTAAKVIDTSVVGTQVAADVAAGTVKDAGDVLSRELNLKRKDLWESRDSGVRKSIENREMQVLINFLNMNLITLIKKVRGITKFKKNINLDIVI